MKIVTKGLVLVLALALLAGLGLSMALSANAAVLILEPNETTSFTIEYSDAWGLEGSIEFSDPSIISRVEFDTTDSGMMGMADGKSGLFFFYTDIPQGANGKIIVRVTLANDVPANALTSIVIRYAVTNVEATTPGKTQVISTTIMSPQVTAPTPPPSTSPDVVIVALDNSALVAQIKTAYALTPSDYTAESWDVVHSALLVGLNALNSGSQTQIDGAASALKYAILTLVPVDYSNLQAVLDSLGQLEDMEKVAEPWARFVTAVNNANAALTSGDQTLVDAAVEELQASKTELLAVLADLGETIEVEKEVEVIVEKVVEKIVEVEKPGECTKPAHTVFLVIMIISLLGNAAMGTVLIIRAVKKRRTQKDDTPLVDYDIDQDQAE